MESRLKVNFDHNKREPYISVFMASLNPDDNDLRDEMLQKLLESFMTLPVGFSHVDGSTRGASYQLRTVNYDSHNNEQIDLVGRFQNYTENLLGIPKEKEKQLFNEFFEMIYSKIGNGMNVSGTFYEVCTEKEIS